ncbi:MAG: hypothetical protein HZB48_06405 [Actinobacteria bacterium]|uniref:hypothetical protein n=1 Tax=Propionicimonas sp. T2.31MG-18 TaxID=3157620 RepID=UPI0035E6A9A5|nr:hypothetical protein [Actinomycetota bacterium]
MAASALDLLIALDARLDDLEATSMTPGSIPRVRQEWGALARASLQLLHVRPHHPEVRDRRIEALLDSLAAIPGEYALPAPGTGLMAITATIGCTAEAMRTRTITSPATRNQAGDEIRASLEAALGRAGRWTQHGFQTAGGAPDHEIVRLAGIDTEPCRSTALHAWRIIGPTDPGIDGAVSRWETAATRTITSPRTVTQLALQLASADIALLCASTSAVMQRAIQTGVISDSSAAIDALDSAGRSWREAARWPSHLRLGGRTTETRHASADLRRCLDDALRSGSDWKQPSDLFAETSPEQLVAVIHSGLQAATRVGRHVLAAMDELTHGASRVWVNAGQIPTPRHTARTMLDNHYDWAPDRVGFHSAEPLHEQTSRALDSLVNATPLTIEALAASTSLPEQVEDEGPWETVSPPADPLRTSQEWARLAAIPSAEPPAPTIRF